MRSLIFLSGVILATCAPGAEEAVPGKGGAEELRTSVKEWIETMQKIQEEEDAWEKDREVLSGYKEGLEKEIVELREQIERAKTRKGGADQQSLDKVDERDRYRAAQEEIAKSVAELEKELAARLAILPEPLKKTPKVQLEIETLQAAVNGGEAVKDKDVSKRLFNLVELLSDIEKFQQMVHVHPEIRRSEAGQEYQVKMVYFGLAMAYGVNEDGTFALVGRPGEKGWEFEERAVLAPQIQKLVASASSEKDANFSYLPLIQP